MLANLQWFPSFFRINSDPISVTWDLALPLLSHLLSLSKAPLTSSQLLNPTELSLPGALHCGSLCSEHPFCPLPLTLLNARLPPASLCSLPKYKLLLLHST